MLFYPTDRQRTPLSEDHRRHLVEESAIAPEIVAERGIRTITRGRDLPSVFSRRQKRRAPGMLLTVHRPNGETSHCFRPDNPDPKDPGHKYEQPSKHYGGPGNVLDIHPSRVHLIDDTSVPVIFVEGIKKADAITSVATAAGVEVLVVAISGVWNFLSDGEPIPDMFGIPVEGRKVSICYDSDMLSNPNVQDAARRLAEHLISRDAEVWITYLPDQPDGSKTGADDFFVAGGAFSELRMLSRRYDPVDFTQIRLSRDEKLSAAIEDLQRRFWAEEWKGQGGHSDRDVALKLIESARRYGKVVDDGVRIVKAWGPLELEAKVSRRTLAKALNRLEKRSFLYRDNKDRETDKAGAFVLRAGVYHQGTNLVTPELLSLAGPSSLPTDIHLRAPRLRWSRPAFTPKKREFMKGTRRVLRKSDPLPARDRIERLGKIRGAILDVLDAAGGTATLREIADALHRKRPRDIRRRNLPMLEEAGILAVEGDVVSLSDNWLDRLKEARELGREIEADEVARVRYKEKSRSYHNRHKTKPDPHWTNNPDADGTTEGLRPPEEPLQQEKPEPKEDPAVAVVLDYVKRLGRIRLGLLEEIWLEDHGGDLKELRRAVDESGVRKERPRENRDAVFLYPPPSAELVA